MATTTSSMWRDANRVSVQGLGFLVTKTMTFDGGTTNDPGDFNGTGNPATLFTVTGDVLCSVFAQCSVNLVGDTATVEVGVANNTAALIPQTTGTDIDAGEVWLTIAPGVGVMALPSGSLFVNTGANIIQTVGTANITAGVITYYCIWRPLSTNGSVV
jgi:hypothetical protein